MSQIVFIWTLFSFSYIVFVISRLSLNMYREVYSPQLRRKIAHNHYSFFFGIRELIAKCRENENGSPSLKISYSITNAFYKTNVDKRWCIGTEKALPSVFIENENQSSCFNILSSIFFAVRPQMCWNEMWRANKRELCNELIYIWCSHIYTEEN